MLPGDLIFCTRGPFANCRLFVVDAYTMACNLVDPVVRPVPHRLVSNPSYDSGDRVILYPGNLADALVIDSLCPPSAKH